MFFPIRCIFWLTIVFTAIYSQDQARRTASVVEMSETVQSVVAKILGHAETRFTEHCARRPAECLEAAAKLSNFARAHAANGALADNWPPLPPLRPTLLPEHALLDRFPRVEELRLHTIRPEG